jgi:beta-lactamase class A
MKTLKITAIFLLISQLATAQVAVLQKQMTDYLKTKKATVGIGIHHFGNNNSLTINNKTHYPMQSVFKLHLCMAILAEVDKGRWTLDSPILVKKSDLLPNTHSPMRDDYPKGNVKLPLSKIIKYTVSQSDNNGCDLLFKLMGGPKKVDAYIKNLGIKNTDIKATEYEMSQAWEVQFTNWTTPSATIDLLKKFKNDKIFSQSSYDFLWQTMLETSTGPKRIKGQLPKGTIVAHKTGSSGVKDGITSGTNDIGFIQLPNKQHIAVVFYVTNSSENEETNQRIIADISKMIWNFYVK